MTPAEKARDLVHRFYISLPNNGGFTGLNNIHSRWKEGKMCASMAVDEIINNVLVGIDLAATWGDYWVKVKQEIEKIKD